MCESAISPLTPTKRPCNVVVCKWLQHFFGGVVIKLLCVQTKLWRLHKFWFLKLNSFEAFSHCLLSSLFYLFKWLFWGHFSLAHPFHRCLCATAFLLLGTLFTIMTLRLRISRQFWFIIRHIRYRQNDVYAFSPNKMELTFYVQASNRNTKIIFIAVLCHLNFVVVFCDGK